MPSLHFSDDMYEMKDNDLRMYDHDENIKKYAEHIKLLMGQAEWSSRRDSVARRFYERLTGANSELNNLGRLFDDRDQFAWYLFLAEAFNDHQKNYEVIFGCRVLPIFSALGRNLDNLTKVGGYESRLQRLMNSEKSQPNGGLFEFLVAAAYVRNSYSVAFHPEQPGKRRTHDLDVERGTERYAIECKRMEGGEYHEAERQSMRELWRESVKLLTRNRKSTYLDINFKVEMPTVSRSYVKNITERYLSCEFGNIIFNDVISYGVIRELDISPIKISLENSIWLQPSPQYNALLTGEYRRYDNLLLVQSVKFSSDPHFIEDVDFSIAARWTSFSETAVSMKARDVFTKVVEANKQLPDDIPGIIHVGFESLGGDPIERYRYQKINASLSNFDPLGKPLKVVFCHSFSPESPLDTPWAFDETCIYYSCDPPPLPLSRTALVIPDEVPVRPGVHWG